MKYCASVVSLFLLAAVSGEDSDKQKQNNLRGLAGHKLPLVLPVIKCTKEEKTALSLSLSLTRRFEKSMGNCFSSQSAAASNARSPQEERVTDSKTKSFYRSVV